MTYNLCALLTAGHNMI